MGDGILMTLSGLIFYTPISFVDFKYISIKKGIKPLAKIM